MKQNPPPLPDLIEDAAQAERTTAPSMDLGAIYRGYFEHRLGAQLAHISLLDALVDYYGSLVMAARRLHAAKERKNISAEDLKKHCDELKTLFLQAISELIKHGKIGHHQTLTTLEIEYLEEMIDEDHGSGDWSQLATLDKIKTHFLKEVAQS